MSTLVAEDEVNDGQGQRPRADGADGSERVARELEANVVQGGKEVEGAPKDVVGAKEVGNVAVVEALGEHQRESAETDASEDVAHMPSETLGEHHREPAEMDAGEDVAHIPSEAEETAAALFSPLGDGQHVGLDDVSSLSDAETMESLMGGVGQYGGVGAEDLMDFDPELREALAKVSALVEETYDEDEEMVTEGGVRRRVSTAFGKFPGSVEGEGGTAEAEAERRRSSLAALTARMTKAATAAAVEKVRGMFSSGGGDNQRRSPSPIMFY